MLVIDFSHVCTGVGLDFTALPVQNVLKLVVRMIRTGRKSKIKQNDAKWTGTLRKSTFSNTARQIASVPAITIDYPTLILPIVNQTSFFFSFFSFPEHIWSKSPHRRVENSSGWFKNLGNRCLLLHLSWCENLIQKYWKTKKLEPKTFWGGKSRLLPPSTNEPVQAL